MLVQEHVKAHMLVLPGQQCSSAGLQQLGTLQQCYEPAPATKPALVACYDKHLNARLPVRSAAHVNSLNLSV